MTTVKRKQAESLLKRLRFENINKFHDLIKLHISFCVELTADELESLILIKLENNNETNSNVKKRRFTRSSAAFMQKLSLLTVTRRSCTSQLGTFGVPLTREGVAEMSQLILFITQNEKNLLEEGIFRISGSASRQRDLRKLLNVGDTVDLTSGKFTVHDVASVLKLYLHELPEPLLTEAHFKIYLQISGFVREEMSRSEKSSAKNRQIRLIRLLILLLSDETADFLKQILSLLKLVSSYSSVNKMTDENLGKIFGPILLCPKNLRPYEIHNVAEAVAFIATFMIQQSDEIFQIPKEVLKDVLVWYGEGSNNEKSSSSPECKTTVQFVDQRKSATDSTKYNTTTALAQLFADVQMMPDGPQKAKLLKQFQSYNRENLGVNCNVASKTSKAATTALKRKLNRTRESLSNLTRTVSRSSLGTLSSLRSSNFSDTVESSFATSRLSDQFCSSVSTITTNEKEAAFFNQEFFCDDDISPQKQETSYGQRNKLFSGRLSCQYNLRRNISINNNNDVIIEKM